jgi:hypothetical protein
MGGGAEKRKTNQMIDEQNKWARNQSNAFNAIAQPQQQQAVTAANNIQGTAFDLMNRTGQGAGWIDPSLRQNYLNTLNGTGGGGGGGGGAGAAGQPAYGNVEGMYNEFATGGGVDAGAIRAAMAGMKDLSKTGGWSPADRAAQGANIASMEEMGRTGGLDADAINRMRGGGVFEDYQKTGGYTPEQISDLRARANSTLPAFYDAVRQGQNRMASIQGGNPAASAAMAARMAREQSAGMRAQTLDTETGLADRIRTGQQWGATGGAGAENALQSLRTSNMLSGTRGAADIRGGMLANIASNRQAGSSGWTQGELGLGDLTQQGREFGIKGLEGIADKKAAAARAAASSGAASNAAKLRGLQWMANFEAGNTMDAAGGMTDLYRSTPGEVNMWNNTILANRGQQMQDTGQAVDQRMANNPQHNWMQEIAGLAGAAGGAMTGLGALGMVGGGGGGGGNASTRRGPSVYGR